MPRGKQKQKEIVEQMQIQVRCGCGGDCREWTIIEVQGVVEVQPAFKEQFQNLEIGQLCRPSSQVLVRYFALSACQYVHRIGNFCNVDFALCLSQAMYLWDVYKHI